MSEEKPPRQLKITKQDRLDAQRIVATELQRTSNPDEVEDLLIELSLPTEVPEEHGPTEIDESEFPF